MNLKKTAINPIIIIFIFLTFAYPASALAQSQLQSEITQGIFGQVNQALTVNNSGDNVDVTSDSNSSTTATSDTNNQSSTTQSVTATANTGHNEANRNISIGGNAGVITTGDALISVIGQVETNDSATNINNAAHPQNSESALTNTGDNSSFTTSDAQSNTYTVRGNNNAVISQSVDAAANTGENSADRNISLGGFAGVITTGTAGISTNYLVAANQGVVLLGGDSNGNGPGSGASIVALNTGDAARYSTNTSRLTSAALATSNQSSIFQSCGLNQNDCTAITGNNSADRNIARNGNAGVVTTSDAVINVNFLAGSNTNDSRVTTGNPHAHSGAQFTNTGDNADLTAASNTTQILSNSVTQTAEVNQQVNATADTGHNTANRNISFGGDAGVITTGNALINIYLGALTNDNDSTLNLFDP